MLKEKALELLKENDHGERVRQAGLLQAEAQGRWQELPSRFQLQGALKSSRGSPIERDFLVSARLNHLHVDFLIQLALVHRMVEPTAEIIDVAAKMLNVAVESILLKEQLANSGTGLIWRIAYYCLPAAGIICLYLLKGPDGDPQGTVSMPKLIQDLSVLVAQIESGSLVLVEDPNHALLAGAAQTIQSVLARVLPGNLRSSRHAQSTYAELGQSESSLNWQPWYDDSGSLDFDPDFWSNLAVHPALLSGA
ncbi:taurine catabolism dioxygenase taud/tfda [Teratosphaeria destructans]|uniref:Taurine catabolism dioxygenase taud/tfda n=1 Tax=Teratosphaeria destructans TaxID=418781 RepID=A0A9W7SJ89_9PEZI|nr:taurine catabolism dioxygenase taud/tfda [Teratosphaeria destructans]